MTSVEKKRVAIGLSALAVILFVAFVLSPFTAWKFRQSKPVVYHTVTYGAYDGGSVQEIPFGYAEGSGRSYKSDERYHQNVADGEKACKIKAVADPGYYFLEWSDGVKDAVRNDSNVKSSFAALAVFRKISDPITVAYKTNGGGRIDCYADQTVQAGYDCKTVTAIPDDNAVFMYWSDGVKTASRTDTRVLENKTVYAVFGYAIEYDTVGEGSIFGEIGQTVAFGDCGTTVTALPATGYRFLRWSDDDPTPSRSEKNVTAPVSVSAVFVKDN